VRRGYLIREVVFVGLLIFINAASGQERPEPVIEQDQLYESFFREVLTAPESSQVVEVRLNGDRRVQMYQRSAQDVIGLNDEEARMLRDTAAECMDKLTELARASIEWRKEAFFQRIESGRASPELETRAQRMQMERLRIISSAREKLSVGCGAARFELLDAFIRSNSAGRGFFPATPAGGA
jgi:hypothetical protein